MTNKNNPYELFTIQRAICSFQNTNNMSDFGYCKLSQYPDKTIIELDLKNLPPGIHGFHIHEYADPRNNLANLGAHYNPYNKEHGNLNESNSHFGDLGNINVDKNGKCNQTIIANELLLKNKDGFSAIGRSMVIHADDDDLGKSSHKDSITNGHSGARLYYGVIGLCKN